ncbi:hypothetical protein K737_301114 [Holospora undulata HU1]|uniref:Uncharacterized protein n=1 Tax=Holospora undulata HU1 TaxID=1321371 RepID=A0A061JH21_9PROT|nr:hypothetical protein K737_301246 [Holospora undulata HU1]ETZ04459.1 hypothetical protein K737_301117 [Holospora undulata HU1]ETZ04498.1 hypothetical protein K737_301114 [Holospora undulata HU1]
MSLYTSNFNTYKGLSLLLFALLTVLGVLCGITNLYVDPYNFYEIDKTPYVLSGNERKIKASYLYSHKNQFRSVLIGSSRSSYLDIASPSNHKTFNFSVSGISINEYLPYLQFFAQTQGNPETIYLSLDFHATNLNNTSIFCTEETLDFATSSLMKALEYIKVKVAHTSLSILFSKPEDYYDREFIKYRRTHRPLSGEAIKQTLDYYSAYNLKNYKYSDTYLQQLKNIKSSFPNTRFIVFICPIHKSLQNHQISLTGMYSYKRWISEIQSIFGKVIDFNNDTNLTTSLDNFFDAAHFYPFVGKQDMLQKLQKAI